MGSNPQSASRAAYRVAVVGAAGMWGRRYLKAYAEHPACQIVGIVDRARDRRQAFAEHYGVPAVWDSIDELLEDELPDIVSVILPVSSSPDVVIRCAEAGVRVVSCEKPIAVTLAEADRMVEVCRASGTALACATAFWEVPCFLDTVDWIRSGSIGGIVEAGIPGGLPEEVSGGGCPQLVMLRKLLGAEVDWVEGWTDPEDAAHPDVDCTAYGRLGFPGPVVCHVPLPPPGGTACRVSARGERGAVWVSPPKPVLVSGSGVLSTPVYPDFLEKVQPENMFVPVIERLFKAFDERGEAACSGHDYRQALEIAIALKLSAQLGHERVFLPLEDRSLGIRPSSYRLLGGDVAGWGTGGYRGPPGVC